MDHIPGFADAVIDDVVVVHFEYPVNDNSARYRLVKKAMSSNHGGASQYTKDFFENITTPRFTRTSTAGILWFTNKYHCYIYPFEEDVNMYSDSPELFVAPTLADARQASHLLAIPVEIITKIIV